MKQSKNRPVGSDDEMSQYEWLIDLNDEDAH